MTAVPEMIDGLPNLAGQETLIEHTVQGSTLGDLYRSRGGIDFSAIKSACAIALHMHQPLVPAGGDDLQTAALISNLQYMTEHPDIGDNHNAAVFRWCYQRMGEFVPQLVGEGKQPRVMLEYSGTLLHGLRLMGADDVLDTLTKITTDPAYWGQVEWLGAPWGHAVAPSTPVQDFRLHVQAWQHHFAGMFGLEALARVKGFSPSEMALPNHPDVAYAFVKTLRDCGYEWVLVQEHTVEQPEDGHHPHRPHLPHRLVCTNSAGETVDILAIIKTQGSDTKLVAQMQPWYEAAGLQRVDLAGHSVPPLVSQIADGENGGVMMNEFPPKFQEVTRIASGSTTPLMNGSEYLEHLFAMGITPADLPVVQPLFHRRIWERMQPGDGPERLPAVTEALRQEDHLFHMEGGSWTSNLSWVQGYDNVLSAMERASAHFAGVAGQPGVPRDTKAYRNALYHLLAGQTSCYRYWGQGLWTDYGTEICRRADAVLDYDF